MPTLTGFHPYDGNFQVQPMTVVASVAILPGAALSAENAGTTAELDLAATDEFIQAVYCDKPIATTDADYASIKKRNVWLVDHSGTQLWKARVSSGTAVAATEVLDYADIVSGGMTLTLTDTNKDFKILRVLSGTANNGVVVGYFATVTAETSA